MDPLDPNLRVFDERTFYLIEGKGFDGQSIALELWEFYAEPFSYTFVSIQEGKLVIDDYSWTGAHAPLPLEARVWLESVARDLLVAEK